MFVHYCALCNVQYTLSIHFFTSTWYKVFSLKQRYEKDDKRILYFRTGSGKVYFLMITVEVTSIPVQEYTYTRYM
jgi:hypothetical protein